MARSARVSSSTDRAASSATEVGREAHHRALSEAVESLATALTEMAGEALRQDLDDLAGAVAAVLDGGDPAAVLRQLRPRARRVGLRNALRSEILRRSGCVAEGEGASDILRLLRALEDLNPSSVTDPGEAASLIPLVEEPDAFELLIEVAHDLRSPLTSILFLSETLRAGRSGRLNEVQRGQLGLIYGAALGLHSVTSDVMDLARSPEHLDEKPHPFTLTDVFQGVADLVRPVAEEKGLELRIDHPGLDHCIGHPLLLSRVLLNLTTNGLKFTSEGYVELSARRKAARAMAFSVRDTGRGMDEGARSDLFEPFKRSNGRPGHFFSGAGLGLSIARRLVRRMGGELDYESRPGWGTRFHFTIELPPSRGF